MVELDWERVSGGPSWKTYRAKVPSGWLVHTVIGGRGTGSGVAFVPDPKHNKWK